MTALRTLATAFVLFAALQVLGDNGGGRFVETPLPADVGSGRDASTMRPQYHLPLDGSAAWSGRDAAAAKPAVVHGAAKWIDGVAGKGLDVSRWAYDQATALVADGVPGVSTRSGTVAFWFKPHWEQKDGEKHVVLSARSQTWRPFRFYFIKGAEGRLDVSFVEKGQVQFLRTDFFEKDAWTHIALAWDAKDGAVTLYRDGKTVDRKTNPGAFAIEDESADLLLQCGDGTDRFKANVGNGVYDDIRLYDTAFSEADAFLLFSGGSAAPMQPVAVPPGGAFTLSHREPALAGSAPILRFRTAGGAAFTLSATGPSRTLSLAGSTGSASGSVECADTLDLRAGYALAFLPQGRDLVFLLDGAEQGRIALDRDIGSIVSMEVAEGVAVSPAGARAASPAVIATPAEATLWSLDGATRRQTGVRRAVSLNGYWRVWPVNDYTGGPPLLSDADEPSALRHGHRTSDIGRSDSSADEPSAEVAPGYMRVPGSFRSPLWNIHRLDPRTGKLDPGKWDWHGQPLEDFRCAWYEREVSSSPVWPDDGDTSRRTWLVFDHFNADVGRIYWNGRLVKAFRQDFKSFPMVPNRIRVDVTGLLAANGRNMLRLYVDRHYVGLWKGKPAIGDHGEICLGDVWLERTPGQLHIASAVALPSWRNKTVTLRVRLANPGAEIGSVSLEGAFFHSNLDKLCKTTVPLTGAAEQVVVWTEPWPDPVPWSAENPQTYDLNVFLSRDGRYVDTSPRQLFGFREAWVENGELYLNGEHLRLRMWTSPGFDRLRYWWGHPEAVGQYVAHVKELGYDTIRNNPWNKGSVVGLSDYFDECDRAGLYLLNQMPTYEDEPRDIYDPEVERFFEAWGGHPSILMWYTDFNTCCYAWNQDPAKLNDADYDPARKRLAKSRAQTAETVMRALDSSRECFQHAGGNSGRIFGSMNYQSYGTPLQEQEDWPAQWAASHTQPLMVVESAFPYPDQFRRFDVKEGDKEHLGAEHAARYFGPSVFAAERFPVPHSASLLWNSDIASGRDLNMMRLSDLHYRRVVRAWRGYNVSAIGDFPCGRDHAYTIHMFGNQRVVWRTGGDPRTPGLKPENADGGSEVQRHPLGDYSRPDYLHGTVKGCFAPLLVFAAGDPDNFTNKDHSFYAGEHFRKSLVVVNDHLHPVTVDYSWTCAGQSGTGRIEVEAGGIVREPIALEAPDVAEKTDATLAVEWSVRDASREEGKGTDSLALRFFPRPDTTHDFSTQRRRDAETLGQSAPDPPRSPRSPRDISAAPEPPRSPRTPREVSAAPEILTQRHRDAEAQSQTAPESPRESETTKHTKNAAAPESPRTPRTPREIAGAPETPRTPRTPREIAGAPEAPRTPRTLREESGEPQPPRVCVYDPRGMTSAILRRVGVEFEQVSSLDDLPPTELLIVGQGAFADSPLDGDLPLCVTDAIVFEQPTNALKRFVMTAPSLRDTFANVPGSPLLAGLDDADLADWRGASDTVPAFVVSDEITPHYPRSKWKCGNGGIVAGCVIRRPSRGNFRTVVSCGFNLEDAALLEERRANGGRIIWCQMDVTSRYGKDPAATRLVDNLLKDFAVRKPEIPTTRKPDNPVGAKSGGTGVSPVLETVNGQDARSPKVFYLGSATDASTLALAGASIPVWDGAARGTVLVLPGANLARLPFAYPRKRVLDFRAAAPDDPVFAGVSPADLYFRNANDLPTPAFDVRHGGGVTFVFLGLAPDGSVKGLWNDEKILRVWSTVLTNLGVPLTPETPYIPDLDAYDGDAFHNW